MCGRLICLPERGVVGCDGLKRRLFVREIVVLMVVILGTLYRDAEGCTGLTCKNTVLPAEPCEYGCCYGEVCNSWKICVPGWRQSRSFLRQVCVFVRFFNQESETKVKCLGARGCVREAHLSA